MGYQQLIKSYISKGLVEENPEIREIDVNPFIVGEKGKGAKVVDARVVL